MKIIAALLFAVTLSACATHGTKFDSAKVDTFQPGITTVEEVTATLGKPYSMSELAEAVRLALARPQPPAQ